MAGELYPSIGRENSRIGPSLSSPFSTQFNSVEVYLSSYIKNPASHWIPRSKLDIRNGKGNIRRVEFRSKLNCLLLVETLLIVGDWCIKPLIYRLVCHNASGSVCHSQCIRGGSECFQQLLFLFPTCGRTSRQLVVDHYKHKYTTPALWVTPWHMA